MSTKPSQPTPEGFPDRVALLEDGWAVRFAGCIESARWKSKAGAEAQLGLLQAGARQPTPQKVPPNEFVHSLFR